MTADNGQSERYRGEAAAGVRGSGSLRPPTRPTDECDAASPGPVNKALDHELLKRAAEGENYTKRQLHELAQRFENEASALRALARSLPSDMATMDYHARRGLESLIRTRMALAEWALIQ